MGSETRGVAPDWSPPALSAPEDFAEHFTENITEDIAEHIAEHIAMGEPGDWKFSFPLCQDKWEMARLC
jgi:hypothetical protein